MMECNRDEALRAKEIAEKKFAAKDIAGAKKFTLKAQNLYPALDGISQMVATLDVHLSAEATLNGEKDWYGILCVSASADDEMVKKQYRKLALMLHPDKNKSVGAEAAFKLISEAWSILSDRARRLAYDQKRNVNLAQQRVPQSHGSSNGFNHFPKKTSSNLRTQKNTARMAPSVVPPQRPSTFWTSCNRCKMQYEYLRVYLNHNLLCPNCHEPFLAVETGNPTNGHTTPVPWTTSQQQQASRHNRNAHGHAKKSSSIPVMGSSGAAGAEQAGNMVNHAYDKLRREEKQGTGRSEEAIRRRNHAQKRTASGILTGNSNGNFSGSVFDRQNPVLSNIERPGKKKRGISDDSVNESGGNESEGKTGITNGNKAFHTVFQVERANFASGARVTNRQSSSLSRELSHLDIRNMLMQKAKTLVQKKLEDLSLEAAAKSAEKEKAKQKQRRRVNDKEKETAVSLRVAPDEIKKGEFININKEASGEKASLDKPSVNSDKELQEPVSIDVPDPDFHDFDKDRSERSFEPDQVWATYDDEDGMPRFYVLVQKVLSLKPFKLRMSFLNTKTNSELGPLNWVGMGFAKTCGDFRVGRYEINDHINIFSHKVRWEKGARGVVRILPRKGDTWALYRNWSPDWNEHTPDDVIYKYDMVEVLDDYSEEQGVTVTPLVKVEGFKTVFHRHLDPKEIKRIPKEEMFRFSHQVPSYLLNGTEAQNAPKGCHELDPAATPLELLQVITEAKEEVLVNTSEQHPAI